MALSIAGCLGVAIPSGALHAEAPEPVWLGDGAGRLTALATLQSLEIELLSQDSATVVLDGWCARHHLAAPGTRIVADRDTVTIKSPTAEQRRLLQASDDEPIRYRRVRLRCGDRTLSEADNWYRPRQLTPAMNAALDGSDTPFGRVVRSLHFHRRTIAARLLWSPLPAGWDSGAPRPPDTSALAIPAHVIENQALLESASGTPFSLVTESYTGHVLDFTPTTFR